MGIRTTYWPHPVSPLLLRISPFLTVIHKSLCNVTKRAGYVFPFVPRQGLVIDRMAVSRVCMGANSWASVSPPSASDMQTAIFLHPSYFELLKALWQAL